VGFGVTWRMAAATTLGTSHEATGAPCQDAVWAEVMSRPDGGALLAVFVADGAGSARQGGVGAAEAVAAAASFVAALPLAEEIAFDGMLARRLLDAVQMRVRDAAAAEGVSVREFATTFQAVLVGREGTFVAQVGDGAVLIDVGAGLSLMPRPPAGEYVNQTQFVTEENAVDTMIVSTTPLMATRVASFSDGLVPLAVDLLAAKPHEPFFAPLFATLQRAEAERGMIEEALQRFLGSERVNARTDDDKSLVLALRLD
jgi:hypothetical protein